MAWQRKILRVDLSAGKCKSDKLNMDWAADYLGQRGLAMKYLMAEGAPDADALSPENNLIFATGPLTGTSASTGGRYSVITKGALTGAIACSNSGGFFGAELKNAGWDMIIVTGRADTPVYLLIEDDTARLIDAAELWGMSVWQTEPAIRSAIQNPNLRIASIGKAGENMVRYAAVVNDLDRAAGRSGVGAVMGSKNLKAVAVHGTGGVKVRDADAFSKVVAVSNKRVTESPSAGRMGRNGTMPMMDVT
ncbi:MAG: aldehyde ferredoxin oxidoreductase, partial [Rhodospirillaceae bacterium]|nr:aldehyde ferredoxin oxidoreductase [Rhodospirillaceae bacterium]